MKIRLKESGIVRKGILTVLTGMLLALQVLTGSCRIEAKAGMCEDELQYFVKDAYWDGSKLAVEGWFENLSSSCDVVEMQDAVLLLVTVSNEIVSEISVNEHFIGSISHNGRCEYNFTTQDAAGYDLADLCIALRCSWEYCACEGAACEVCGGTITDNTSYGHEDPCGTVQEEEADHIQCSACMGSGVCKDCEGEGKTAHKKYGIFGAAYEVKERCVLCEGSGKCYKCEGKGEIPY